MKTEELLSELEIKILSSIPDWDLAWNYRFLIYELKLTREELAPAIKHLRQLGFLKHVNGLFNEDGETMGSGWLIPYEKWAEVRELLDYQKKEENEPVV